MFISKQEFSIPSQMWKNICQTVEVLCSKVCWRLASTNQVEKQYMNEPTQNIHSCIRWAESKFSKLSWTQHSLCTFHLQSVGWDEAKWEEPAICSFNLKNKLFLEKKKIKSLLLHVNFTCLAEHIKMTLCWVSTVASALISPAVASPTRQWGKKTWGKGRLGQREPHTSNRN